MSVTVLVVLVVGFSYFAVHAASQVLRKWSLSWEQEAVSGQFLPEAGFRLGGMHLHLSKTFKGVQGKWKSFVCKWVVPIFCEGDDERLIVQWSRAKVKVEFAMHKIPSGGYSPLVWLKHLRCFILRVGNFYQKSMVVKALEGFTDAWVFQFDQTCLPRVPIHQVLCALTAANLNVPNKIQKKGLKMVWMEEVKKVCQAMKASGPEGLQIPILEFGRTVRKFVMLSAADAFDMVEDVCSLLEENNTASAKQKEVLPLEPVANLQDDLEFRAVLPGCEEASGVGTKTKTSMNQVMPWSSEDSEEEVAPDLLVQIEQDKPQKVKQLEKQLAETERVKDLEAKLEEMEREQSKLRKLLRDYQKAEQLQIQEKLKQRLKEVAEKRRAIEALEEDCREALKMKENSDQMDVLEIMQDLADQRFKNDEAEEKLNKALEEVSVLPLDGGSELRKVSEVLEDMWGTMPSAKTWALASQEAVAQGAASSCQKSEVPQLLT